MTDVRCHSTSLSPSIHSSTSSWSSTSVTEAMIAHTRSSHKNDDRVYVSPTHCQLSPQTQSQFVCYRSRNGR